MQKVIDRERLSKLVTLANFLDDLPHSKFHMPTWSSPDRTDTSCGTAGCACGWAATIFHKEGWTFYKDNEFPYYEEMAGYSAFSVFFGISYVEAFWITSHLDNSEKEDHLSGINTKQVYGFTKSDLEKLGLSYTDEYKLKTAEDITPFHAAARIRKVIATYDPSLLEEKKTIGTLVDVLA